MENQNLSNMDSKLTLHPLFLLKDDNILSFIIQALELTITSPQQVSIIQEIQGHLKEHLFNTVFGDEEIKKLLQSGILDAGEKTICGKRLTEPGIYWRCLDCEKIHELQSSLCSNCYDQSDHEGHRVCMVKLRNGLIATCDCGDADVLSQEGSCPKHQTQELDVKTIREKIPPILMEKFQLVIKKAFYCATSLFEIGQRAQNHLIKASVFQLATQTLNEVLDFCQKTTQEISGFFSAIIGIILQEKFLNDCDKVWHNCEDILVDEDPSLVNVEQAHQCQCSILGNIMRIGNVMKKPEQSRVEKFILECSTVHSIKEDVGIEFIRYIAFLISQDYSGNHSIEVAFGLFSELLQMAGHLYIRESSVRKHIDLKSPEILLKLLKKILTNSEKCDATLLLSISSVLSRISGLFEPRFNLSEALVKENYIQHDLFELFANFQRKFYYENNINIGTFNHEIDYLSIILGTGIEADFCEALECFLATFCKFPEQEKLSFSKQFMKQWYSEFVISCENHKIKQNNSQFSFFPSFQRILCSFLLNYLKNSFTSEEVKNVFKETLSEIEVNEFAQKVIGGTLQTFGLIRYVFVVISSSFEGNYWEYERDLKQCIFEKDILTLQLLIPQVEPELLLTTLTKNFFCFNSEICDFFKNPSILNINDENYK